MKSRTSFCNAAVLKRTLYKGLPLWGLYLAIWLFVLPVTIYTGDRWRDAMDLREYILSLAAHSSQPVGALYGLGSAAMVFLYLYKSRTANFFASLPLTRGEMFRTNFLAGLLYAAAPHLLVALLCVPAAMSWGMFLLKDLASWFAVMTLVYLFYYSFAVLLALIVSNLIALPLLFGVLNFTAVVIEAIVRSLLYYFIYGYNFRGNFLFDWASPLYITVLQGDGMQVDGIWDSAAMVNTDYYLTGWNIVWIMGAVSLVFIAAAWVVHHFRRMESAGDVIAVRHLKPVFLYCFTVGCSIVLGCLMAELLLNSSVSSGDFFKVLLCVLAGSFVGYFTGQMMLYKSLRVFRKRHWLNWTVVGVVISAVMLCVRFDVMGYARYVPEIDEIKSVTVMGLSERSGGSEDPKLIEQVRTLHQDCLANQAEIERLEDNGILVRIYLDYELTDGSRVTRQYAVPNEASVAEDLVRRYENIANDPDYKVHRLLPHGYTAADIEFCSIYNNRNDTEVILTKQEAYDFLKTCLEPDLRDSTMEEHRWLEEPVQTVQGSIASVTVEKAEEYTPDRYTGINIQIQFSRNLFDSANSHSRYCYFDVTTDATRILAYAAERGVEPWTGG